MKNRIAKIRLFKRYHKKNKKIKKLLEILDSPSEYISIDISKDFLLENSKKLAQEFPNLKIKESVFNLDTSEQSYKYVKKYIKENYKNFL